MKKYIASILLATSALGLQAQGLDGNVEERLTRFFSEYQPAQARIGTCKLDSFALDHQRRKLDIYPSVSFGYQPFTPENVEQIYGYLKKLLPGPVNYYDITIHADGKTIEELIPNHLRKKKDKTMVWKKEYKGNPWTKNISRPYEVEEGLEGRHIALWQSHGKYYINKKGEWGWQRPRLFGTAEDLFTQSFVVPYLIPMLENAGAVVFTPRERDWQRHEVIVDNDGSGAYQEVKSRKGKWNTTPHAGFAHNRATYVDGQNPFEEGSARFAKTEKKPEKAFAQWIPNIPETGRYAVYVSYQSLPNSVSDAKYLVFHKGGVTEFLVNQRIGGGTWVYLGHFEFDKGTNDYGMVVLSNQSKQKGVVCADAVRFGGGMGNMARNGQTSGLPRWMEAARYNAQWSGMPAEVYMRTDRENDYADDLNTRSHMINYLSGGSVYNPTEKGLGVPFEMSMAFHSDAGFSKADEWIGTLGVYTTNFNEGKLNSGVSRYASRDLTDIMMTQIQDDVSFRYGTLWPRRGMWNRNYSETRLPAVPSMILEILSHQNFADMRMGHNPDFKFTVARSVYKSILKHNAMMHDADYVVQPLPVTRFAIQEGGKNSFRLSWQGVIDPQEPSAKPDSYIVYTRLGHGGWDNGTLVKGNSYTFQAEEGLVYSFKVTALNKGGESFPSEILSAYHAPNSKGTVLIVNAFDRTSGPATFESDTQQGFDMLRDPGVPYISTTAYCGPQLSFDRSKIGKETPDGLGYSSSEWEGMQIAGNTFDYPFLHGKAIQASGGYSFVSCSDEAIEQSFIRMEDYPVVDFILGAEKSILSNKLQERIGDYTRQGGNLLVSGSYLGSILPASLAQNTLKFTHGGSMYGVTTGQVSGANSTMTFPTKVNEKSYAVPAPDCLLPVGGAYSTYVYTPGNYGAGIAYKGADYRTFVLGFPFESIDNTTERAKVMKAALGLFE
ncbi:MAG: xanthan lyase [Bacteroidaceae bacterium]|nr:xanthan lyase [Bacteroidaceae bacterium]